MSFLPDGNGVEAIVELKASMIHGEIIMLTTHGNIADGMKVIKNEAYDYLTKGDDSARTCNVKSYDLIQKDTRTSQ